MILQIHDGKVLTQRGVIDNLPALRRLGAVPPAIVTNPNPKIIGT
jgi:hypothetical protein